MSKILIGIMAGAWMPVIAEVTIKSQQMRDTNS